MNNYCNLLINFVLLADAVLHRCVVYVCDSSVGLIIAYLNSPCPEAFVFIFFSLSFLSPFFALESREVRISYIICEFKKCSRLISESHEQGRQGISENDILNRSQSDRSSHWPFQLYCLLYNNVISLILQHCIDMCHGTLNLCKESKT